MKWKLSAGLALGVALLGVWTALSQPDDKQGRPEKGRPPEKHDRDRPPPPPLLEALDLDGDGEISAEEIRKASESLRKLDRNKDGKLTPDEIHPHGRPPHGRGPREARDRREDDRGPPPGQGRRGPPPDRDEDRPPPPPPPRPGEVLPPPVRDMLDLTREQHKQLDELEKDVRARLARILTPEQRQRLEHHRPPHHPGGPPGHRERPPEKKERLNPPREDD